MSSERWTHSCNTVFNIGYHIIFCPKYRRGLLIGGVAALLEKSLHRKAKELKLTIASLEIMPDHVHMFIKSKPTAAPHWIVQQMKGYSSRILRKKYPQLTSLPCLWTRSYYCESVGHISEEVIKRYINEQKLK